MFRNMRNIKSLFIIIIFTTSLSACKIDFEGDIYTSDLMDVLENRSQIDIPMLVSFQVSSCDEDLYDLHSTLSDYFLEYSYIGCEVGNDFMSYVTSRVRVPINSSQDDFENADSLIGYLVQEFDDGIYVYTMLNQLSFDMLSNYVESQTFQSLDLSESTLIVNVHNDLRYLNLSVFPGFVDGDPTVYVKDYEMEKRDILTILNSDSSAAHLQIYGWSPIFYIQNNQI